MKCLLVEDDIEIAMMVKLGLNDLNISVEMEPNGRRAFEKALTNDYDIILLDLMLPDMDGYNFVTTLREREFNTPILILSALSDLEDRLKGLSQGGDDYLTKPFAMSELQIRIKTLLKRTKKTSEVTKLVFQDLKLNRLNRQVTRNGQELDLQEREFILLDLFMSNPNKIISKQTILREVWNYSFDPQTNVVDVLVCRLRGKVEKSFATRLIYTVRGVGYVFKADTTETVLTQHIATLAVDNRESITQ